MPTLPDAGTARPPSAGLGVEARPLRSKRCRELRGELVLRFDHYCPWVCNAIGAHNQRSFLAMLGAQRLVVAVSFISVLSHVRACARLCASDEPCAFEVLLYADQDATVADEWAETDAKFIANSEDMRLRSFSTKVHKVHSQVAYKVDDD